MQPTDFVNKHHDQIDEELYWEQRQEEAARDEEELSKGANEIAEIIAGTD